MGYFLEHSLQSCGLYLKQSSLKVTQWSRHPIADFTQLLQFLLVWITLGLPARRNLQNCGLLSPKWPPIVWLVTLRREKNRRGTRVLAETFDVTGRKLKWKWNKLHNQFDKDLWQRKEIEGREKSWRGKHRVGRTTSSVTTRRFTSAFTCVWVQCFSFSFQLKTKEEKCRNRHGSCGAERKAMSSLTHRGNLMDIR